MSNVINYKSIYTPKKAKRIKRLAAFMIDVICIIIVFTGVLYLAATISNYANMSAELEQLYIDLGVKIPGEKEGQYVFCEIGNKECEDALKTLYGMDEFYVLFDGVQNFLIYGPIGSLFVSLLIFELIVPLILKNGQTIGMKLFNVGLISKNDIRVKPLQIFVRFLFGKFIINGIVPLLGILYIFVSDGAGITGAMLLLLFLIANLACYGVGKNYTFVPDTLSGVYPIDMQEQIFFDSEAQLMAAKAEEQRYYNKKR